MSEDMFGCQDSREVGGGQAAQHPTVHRMAPSLHNKELSSPKGGARVKNLPANAGDTGDASLIAGLERSPGEGKGYPLQYSGLESFMDCIVHGVAKSWTQLSDCTLSQSGRVEKK